MSSTIKTVAFLIPFVARSPVTSHRSGGGRRCYRFGPASAIKRISRPAVLNRLPVADLPPTPRPVRHVASAPGTSAAAVTMASSSPPEVTLALDDFCVRQFDDPEYAGTRLDWDKVDFEARVNGEYEARLTAAEGDAGAVLKDGYAPFCKHLFMKNFIPSATLTTLPITPDNEHLLRTKYAARTEKELPVLTRFFPLATVEAGGQADWLDVILYSREQIIKERASRPGDEPDGAAGEEAIAASMGDAPWRIISVKAQEVDTELPMQPITVMRNALIGEGGSGVGIQREAYEASVAYWKDRAVVL